MKKRVLMVLLTAVFVAGGAFAQPEFKLSAGAGGFLGGDFGGGVNVSGSYYISGYNVSEELNIEMPYFGGGGYAFFDLTYAELSIGYFAGKAAPTMTHKARISGTVMSQSQALSTYTISSLNLGLFGKYPFEINDKFLLFPLFGVEYQAALSVKDENGEEYTNLDGKKTPGDLSALWFKAGVGMDFLFTDSVFLRLNVLYGIRLPNKMEQDMANYYKKNYFAGLNAKDIKAETLLGHGLTAKLAVGFRF